MSPQRELYTRLGPWFLSGAQGTPLVYFALWGSTGLWQLGGQFLAGCHPQENYIDNAFPPTPTPSSFCEGEASSLSWSFRLKGGLQTQHTFSVELLSRNMDCHTILALSLHLAPAQWYNPEKGLYTHLEFL